MPPLNEMIAFHEQRIGRVEEQANELAQQVADHLGEARVLSKNINDQLEKLGEGVERLDAKLDAQGDRIAKLEHAVSDHKRRDNFFRKYWSHGVLALLGAAGAALGKQLIHLLLP